MPQLTKIDRQTHDALHEAMRRALAPLEAHYGIKIRMAGGRFSNGDDGIFKFEAKIQGSVGQNLREQEFRKHAWLYNLKPEWFGAQIAFNGHTYTITGLAGGRSKYSICVRRSDGKESRVTPDTVRNTLVYHSVKSAA